MGKTGRECSDVKATKWWTANLQGEQRLLCSSASRQTPKQLTPRAEFHLLSKETLSYFLWKEFLESRTGTAGSDLMKSQWLWLIIHFHGASSPHHAHTYQKPGQQVLHSPQESVPMAVNSLVLETAQAMDLSLPSCLSRTEKGKFTLLNQNNEFLTSNHTLAALILSSHLFSAGLSENLSF